MVLIIPNGFFLIKVLLKSNTLLDLFNRTEQLSPSLFDCTRNLTKMERVRCLNVYCTSLRGLNAFITLLNLLF